MAFRPAADLPDEALSGGAFLGPYNKLDRFGDEWMPGAGAAARIGEAAAERAVAKEVAKAVVIKKVGKDAAAEVTEHAGQTAARKAAQEAAKAEAERVAEAEARRAAEANAGAAARGKPGSYTPDRTLPTDKKDVPTPDSQYPHTQLGRSKPKYGSEAQAIEWD